jgi:hypothetical protein
MENLCSIFFCTYGTLNLFQIWLRRGRVLWLVTGTVILEIQRGLRLIRFCDSLNNERGKSFEASVVNY